MSSGRLLFNLFYVLPGDACVSLSRPPCRGVPSEMLRKTAGGFPQDLLRSCATFRVVLRVECRRAAGTARQSGRFLRCTERKSRKHDEFVGDFQT